MTKRLPQSTLPIEMFLSSCMPLVSNFPSSCPFRSNANLVWKQTALLERTTKSQVPPAKYAKRESIVGWVRYHQRPAVTPRPPVRMKWT
jgi:hypothetical protein